jgi:hypothetical protein
LFVRVELIVDVDWLQHQVKAIGPIRFALTSRYVEPKDPESAWKGDYVEDATYHYDGDVFSGVETVETPTSVDGPGLELDLPRAFGSDTQEVEDLQKMQDVH